jgi:short-subunit dehydrogenase
MGYFSNKIVWITGASSGIGEALAIALSKEGAKLILSSRRKEVLEKVREQCVNPADCRIVILDLENSGGLEAKAREAISQFGTIDIVVHNGGISQRSLVKDTSMEVQRRVMEVDYFSYVALTKYLLPEFLRKGDGQFVVISSVMGKIGTPMRSAYAAAKHALHGFFDCLRAELSPLGIGVTVITPGFIRTNVTLNALTGNGAPFGSEGVDIGNGLAPEVAAQQILRAVAGRKPEAYVGKKGKEKLALIISRFLPGVFFRLAPKQVPK